MSAHGFAGDAPAFFQQPSNAKSFAWTADEVGARLIKAFQVLDRLPRVKGPRAPGGHWVRHAIEWADQLAQAELPEAEREERTERRNRDLLRPTGADIEEMDRVLEWLRDLREADPGLALVASLWAYRAARHKSIKALCAERHWAPHTFYRKRAKALDYLANLLTARGTAVF